LDFVRFTPESGHRATRLACPLCAKSGHSHCSKQHVIDHLVGSGLQCQRAASILQREPSARRRLQVVAPEAHDANEHLRSHREIVRIGGAARLAALAPITSTGEVQFGGLISPRGQAPCAA
jgi:hypothetical protein